MHVKGLFRKHWRNEEEEEALTEEIAVGYSGFILSKSCTFTGSALSGSSL